MTAHDLTSQIVAPSVKDSPFLTGKKKRIGVSSARLNPATRVASRRDEAGGGGGVREGLFSSHAPIACGRESLINHSNSLSTSKVVLNFSPPLTPTWALGIFLKFYMGLKPMGRFQQSPTRSRRPIVLSFVPNTVLIYQYFSENRLRLSFT